MEIHTCPCIEKSTAIDLKLTLMTARNAIYKEAKELEKKGSEHSYIDALKKRAERLHTLFDEISKTTC
jgi:hypothetical protein